MEEPYHPSWKNTLCCIKSTDRNEVETVLRHLDLTVVQKQIIQSRYINMLEHVRKRVLQYSRMYYLGHIIITVGSLIVPALLSVQNSSSMSTTGSTQIYWVTFTLSLLVTTFNAVLALFKIDKKYYFLNTTLERLRTEGWQFVGLTGRYSGHLSKTDPTHQNQFVFFTHQIEKIKMKQVEEEYYKTDEKITQTPPGGAQPSTQGKSDLYPPSPDQPIQSMVQQIPDPVKNTIHYMIQSQTVQEPISPAHLSTLAVEPLSSNPLFVPPVSPPADEVIIDTANISSQ